MSEDPNRGMACGTNANGRKPEVIEQDLREARARVVALEEELQLATAGGDAADSSDVHCRLSPMLDCFTEEERLARIEQYHRNEADAQARRLEARRKRYEDLPRTLPPRR